MLLPDLSRRRRAPELMDLPGLAPEEHHQALRALSRVNLLSLTARRSWEEVARILEKNGGGAVRVLDVACGGGDVVVALAERARRAGAPVEFHGCDVSPLALEHGRERARRRGLSVQFFRLDAGASPFPPGYDLICSSLFLHHLGEEEAVRFLAALTEASRAFLVQDLLRSWAGYALAWGTLRVMSRSRVARVDGPLSVRASFRMSEVRELARGAGLKNVRLRRCWPQRFALSWEKS